MFLDGEDIILQVHRVFTRIRSGASLVASSGGALLTVKIRQPSHEFTFGVGMTFLSYPLVLIPVV
jgi:hypothetical protein